jgi:FkbH-like protein
MSGTAILEARARGETRRADEDGTVWTPTLGRGLSRAVASRRNAILASWRASQFDPERIDRFGIAAARDHDLETLERLFLGPLFNLLLAYIRTRADRYRVVYLDERLRYAPIEGSLAQRVAFFEEVLEADEAALLGPWLSTSAPGRVLRRLLRELHAPLREPPATEPVRVLALGDCLMTELRAWLHDACRRSGLGLDLRKLYFSASQGRELSAGQALDFLKVFPAELVALSFLSFEGIPPYTALLREADRLSARAIDDRVTAIARLMREFLAQLREHTEAPFLVHNASGLHLTMLRKYVPLLRPLARGRRRVVQALNAAIDELVEHTPNAILIDEAAVASARGLRACAAYALPRRLFRETLFHTTRFGAYLAEPYTDVLRSYRALHRTKVLLVDFDNTLWDGVMADGPVVHRHELQALLRRLKDAGILLVAVSKNDPANLRWHEMTLRPEDFVLLKVSWNLKVQSIREAAQELDLGPDTFVLIDDNPAERELVRGQLPMVQTLDPADPTTLRWLGRMTRFPNTRETEEARARTDLYRQQARRREVLAQPLDYAAMMASLGLEARFGPARRGDLDRIAELVQRTNQFNTTTIRYSKPQLRAMLESDRHVIYVVSLSDKFGDIGLAAVAIIERRGDERIFDSFLMSCRAMGFELERLLLRLVLDAESPGTAYFVGRYVPTDRNTPARDLFPAHGFTRQADGQWHLPADAPRPERPPWFRVQLL